MKKILVVVSQLELRCDKRNPQHSREPEQKVTIHDEELSYASRSRRITSLAGDKMSRELRMGQEQYGTMLSTTSYIRNRKVRNTHSFFIRSLMRLAETGKLHFSSAMAFSTFVKSTSTCPRDSVRQHKEDEPERRFGLTLHDALRFGLPLTPVTVPNSLSKRLTLVRKRLLACSKSSLPTLSIATAT